MKINKKAWEILNTDEQEALQYQLGLGKSSWQASEIMGKVHYKYLEIFRRAQTFLKVFTNYFEVISDELISDHILESLNLDKDFKIYIECVIQKRMTPSSVSSNFTDKSYQIVELREKMIIQNMGYLQNSESIEAIELYNLIKDFDRWNNFRILPIKIQEPHAFKRRNKKRLKKYVDNILSINEHIIYLLEHKYALKNPASGSLFIPIPLEMKIEFSKVIIIRNDESLLKRLSNAGIFVFSRVEDCKQFIKLVVEYFGKDSRHCTDGQKFWPQFRVLIKEAYNYEDVEKIPIERKYLESAYRDFDNIRAKKYQKN